MVGMGKELASAFPEARVIFEEVDDALGASLSNVMWEGPAESLMLTENAQPALMAVSLAMIRVLEKEKGWRADQAQYVAGHSLGEYSALAAAGTLSVADAAKLLRVRGQAMQEAVPVGEGAMAALLGADLDSAARIAEACRDATGQVCEIANDNAPGQVVISGAKVAVDHAGSIVRDFGVKRAVPLPVSAPFHCSLMQPAADRMAEALAKTALQPPKPALVANVTAGPVTDAGEIRRLLVSQVTGTVRWRETILFMAEQGITQVYEVGAGKVLSGMAGRIDSRLTSTPVGTPADLDQLTPGALGSQAGT